MSFRPSDPVGVVLAGGLGRRLGGSKATVRLHGAPLISYPLRAIGEALGGAVIVAKADSELPSLSGVEVWIEPDRPRHPLAGLVHALRLAQGRPVLVCACDLPLVTADLIRELASAAQGGAMAVLARVQGRLQPLLGCYQPGALPSLADSLRDAAPVLDAVAVLKAQAHDVADPSLLFNVNTPEDLLQAGVLLRNQPKVKS